MLSGLSPSIIMECAGRGLSFYSYQATQEMFGSPRADSARSLTALHSVYQEYLAKSLTDKYSNLSTQLDQIIHEANSEIVTLRNKLSGSLSSACEV